MLRFDKDHILQSNIFFDRLLSEQDIENVNMLLNHFYYLCDENQIDFSSLEIIVKSVYKATTLLNRKLPYTPRDKNIENYEEIFVENNFRENVNHTWYITSNSNSDRLIVMVHGWGSGKSSKSGHSMVDYLPKLLDFGDIIMFDQAGHGYSNGKYSFGYNEWQDILSVTEYIQKRKAYSQKILLAFSIGCFAAYNLIIKNDIFDKYILDSFTEPNIIFKSENLHYRLFNLPISYAFLSKPIFEKITNTNNISNDLYEVINNSNILLCRSLLDNYLDEECYKKIYKIFPNSIKEYFEHSGHVRSFFSENKKWNNLVTKFIGGN